MLLHISEHGKQDCCGNLLHGGTISERNTGHTTVTTVSLAQDDTKTIDYIFESKQQL